MPYKQGYGKIIERSKYLMLTVHPSAERLLPIHPGKKSCCPLNLQKQNNRNYSLLFKNNDLSFLPQEVLPNKGVGGLGSHIKFGGKIWGKVRPSSQNKRKNLGSSVTKRRKSWEKVPILGSYLKFRGQNSGYLSFIFLEAKFGAPTRISEAKFGAKPPPDLLIWKYPPGVSPHNFFPKESQFA